VDAVDRGEHRGGEHRCGERRGRAQRDQRAASGLGGAGGYCVALAGAQAKTLEHAGGRIEAVTAKPSEQLLRAVSNEESAHGNAENESSQFHKIDDTTTIVCTTCVGCAR
jgi:hypothetical protein